MDWICFLDLDQTSLAIRTLWILENLAVSRAAALEDLTAVTAARSPNRINLPQSLTSAGVVWTGAGIGADIGILEGDGAGAAPAWDMLVQCCSGAFVLE